MGPKTRSSSFSPSRSSARPTGPNPPNPIVVRCRQKSGSAIIIDNDNQDDQSDQSSIGHGIPANMWSTTQVSAWIEEKFDEKLAKLFEDQQISGDVLQDLSENDLLVMGILALGVRKKLMRTLQQLFPPTVSLSNGIVTTAPAPVPVDLSLVS